MVAANNTPSRPKRALSAYNLFYRYKRGKILQARQENNDNTSKEAITKLVTSPAGLEDYLDLISNDAVESQQARDIRRSEVRSALANNLSSKDNSKRSHRKQGNGSSMSFVEMSTIMCSAWQNIDEFGRSIFDELAEEGRQLHRKEIVEFKNKFPNGVPPSAVMASTPQLKKKTKYNNMSSAAMANAVTPTVQRNPMMMMPHNHHQQHPMNPMMRRASIGTCDYQGLQGQVNVAAPMMSPHHQLQQYPMNNMFPTSSPMRTMGMPMGSNMGCQQTPNSYFQQRGAAQHASPPFSAPVNFQDQGPQGIQDPTTSPLPFQPSNSTNPDFLHPHPQVGLSLVEQVELLEKQTQQMIEAQKQARQASRVQNQQQQLSSSGRGYRRCASADALPDPYSNLPEPLALQQLPRSTSNTFDTTPLDVMSTPLRNNHAHPMVNLHRNVQPRTQQGQGQGQGNHTQKHANNNSSSDGNSGTDNNAVDDCLASMSHSMYLPPFDAPPSSKSSNCATEVPPVNVTSGGCSNSIIDNMPMFPDIYCDPQASSSSNPSPCPTGRGATKDNDTGMVNYAKRISGDELGLGITNADDDDDEVDNLSFTSLSLNGNDLRLSLKDNDLRFSINEDDLDLRMSLKSEADDFMSLINKLDGNSTVAAGAGAGPAFD